MIHKRPHIGIYFDQRREKSNGKYPVKLRLTAKWLRQQYKYFYIGIDLTQEEWKQVEGKNKSKDIASIRNEINEQLADARRIVNDLDYYTHGAFEDRFIRGVVKSEFVYDFFNQKIESLINKNKFSTADGYKGALSALKSFRKGRDIYFQDVTFLFISRFIQHLSDTGLSSATVTVYFRYLKAIYETAIQRGLVPRDPNPFKDGEIELPEIIHESKALSDDVIRKIINYSSEDKNKQLARDLWVFSYAIGGANMPDLAKLTKGHLKEQAIVYFRGKTGRAKSKNEAIIAPITKESKYILNRYKQPYYLLPILAEGMNEKEQHQRTKWYSKKVNKYLTPICKELGIEKATFGSARHSFATRMRRMGVDSDMIGIKMGHSEDSKMTDHYIKRDVEQYQDYFNKLTDF